MADGSGRSCDWSGPLVPPYTRPPEGNNTGTRKSQDWRRKSQDRRSPAGGSGLDLARASGCSQAEADPEGHSSWNFSFASAGKAAGATPRGQSSRYQAGPSMLPDLSLLTTEAQNEEAISASSYSHLWLSTRYFCKVCSAGGPGCRCQGVGGTGGVRVEGGMPGCRYQGEGGEGGCRPGVQVPGLEWRGVSGARVRVEMGPVVMGGPPEAGGAPGDSGAGGAPGALLN